MNKYGNLGSALITGASTGIGAAYAQRLAQRGFDLCRVARGQARLDALAARLLADAGVSVENLRADLTVSTEVAKVAHRLNGLDLGETVTIPSLPELGDWDALNAIRLSLAPRLSLQHSASRYRNAAS